MKSLGREGRLKALQIVSEPAKACREVRGRDFPSRQPSLRCGESPGSSRPGIERRSVG